MTHVNYVHDVKIALFGCHVCLYVFVTYFLQKTSAQEPGETLWRLYKEEADYDCHRIHEKRSDY